MEKVVKSSSEILAVRFHHASVCETSAYCARGRFYKIFHMSKHQKRQCGFENHIVRSEKTFKAQASRCKTLPLKPTLSAPR